MQLNQCLIDWFASVRFFLRLLFFGLRLLLFLLVLLRQLEETLVNRTVSFRYRELINLRFAGFSGKLLLCDCTLNAILSFLLEVFLILEEIFLRPRLAVLLFNNLRRKCTMLQLRVYRNLTLLFNTGEAALLPLFKPAVVILLVFKFALYRLEKSNYLRRAQAHQDRAVKLTLVRHRHHRSLSLLLTAKLGVVAYF